MAKGRAPFVMKRIGNLWPQVTSFSNLLGAAEAAAAGKRKRPDVAAFLLGMEWELLTHMGQSPAFQEDKLAMRIADEVSSRLAVATSESNRDRTRCVREREAAKYIGVTVSTLRSWRTKRSKNGPPYTRLGRMVMYPIVELEEHMKARTVPPRH